MVVLILGTQKIEQQEIVSATPSYIIHHHCYSICDDYSLCLQSSQMIEDNISDAWSESRINKPKNYPMPLWLTDEEFEYVVQALWKCRKNTGEPQCGKLYERLRQILEVSKSK